MESHEQIHWENALKGLNEQEIGQIEQSLTWKEVGARTPIFLQGESADALFIIRSGRVRLVHYMEGGDEFTTGVWSEGYIIGLISAFLGAPRFLSAESVDEVRLQVFKRQNLHQCMQSIHQFTLNIAHLLALFASDSIRRAAPLALESVEAKLGRVLVNLAVPEAGENDRVGYLVRGITQEDLARMVGASRPWVNQALAAFEKRGLIERHKQLIRILDMEACQRLQMK